MDDFNDDPFEMTLSVGPRTTLRATVKATSSPDCRGELHVHHYNPIEPPADRYCDLIMKGGITSGVVYPEAINRLSRQYRFKNIGGSSAGGMAAALTAAAEYPSYATSIDLLIDAALTEPVAEGYDKVLSPEQAQTLRELVGVLSALMNAFDAKAGDPLANPFVPLPKPELRVQAPL